MKNLLNGWNAIFLPYGRLRSETDACNAKLFLPCGDGPRPCNGMPIRVVSKVAAGVLLALLVSAGCIGEDAQEQRSKTAAESPHGNPEADIPINMGQAGVMRPMSITELSRESVIVVVGTVRQVSAGEWSTPDGRRPSRPLPPPPDRPLIFREALLQVEEYIKGALDAKQLTIHLYGGKVGADTMWVEDEATLDAGERVLLFLSRDNHPQLRGRPGYVLTGRVQAKYTITDGVASGIRPYPSEKSLPLEQLITRIRSAIAG